MRTLPENYKIVEALAPAADAGGRTSDWVSLKNVQRLWIFAHVNQGAAATIALVPKQATDVAGAGVKNLTSAARIWANQDCAASDALPQQTDATSFTTDAGVKHKLVVFEVDPAGLDISGGFDSVAIATGASDAANITEALFVAELRYGSASPPSIITD